MSTSYSIEDIINKDILELMGAKNMSDEEKLKLYKKIADTIYDRVFIKIDNMLSDKDVEDWKKVLDTKDSKQIQEFLQSKNIDFMKMVLEESLIYKTEITSLMQATK